MFVTLKLQNTFRDIGGNQYFCYDLIDTEFIKKFCLCERSGKDWDPSIECRFPKRKVNKINLYNGIINNIYNYYRYSGESSCRNMSKVIKDLFHHLPDDIRMTEFYLNHKNIVEKGLE